MSNLTTRQIDWHKLDWSMGDRQLSAMLDCSHVTVWMHRNLLCNRKPIRKTRLSFKGVDWSLPKSQIAKLLGCSRQRVYQKYQELQKI